MDDVRNLKHLNSYDATQSIDLMGLFTRDLTSSGSFDIRGEIWTTTFGKLLQAIPIPALLVDGQRLVVVANQACARISEEYEGIQGKPFASLCKDPHDKAAPVSVLDESFRSRKPAVAQGYLKIGGSRIWGRMTFRSIRIVKDRFVLVLIEDLTNELKLLRLGRKYQEELQERVSERTDELVKANALLKAQVAERRRVEKEHLRLVTAVEQSAESIVITDSLGTILYVNPAFERISGYEACETVGNPCPLLAESSGEGCRTLRETVRAGNVWTGRFTAKRKDGTDYEEEATISPVRDDAGNITNFVEVKRDVTREVTLEAQLRQAQKMEAIGTLAGGIAHDFNNLLQILLGYADLLLVNKSIDERASNYVKGIQSTALRGAELVQRVLTFSRKVEPNFHPIDLNHEIRESQKVLVRTMPKMIEIALDLTDDLKMVNADSGQMNQILLNLAINARDAMPDDGRISIETKNITVDEDYCLTCPEVKPGRYVQLSVSDTGHGMDKNLLDRIFEPFFTTKQPGEGTGLGLAIVFGIVKSHGGHITCYSGKGVGTTFRIYLPAIEEAPLTDLAATSVFRAFGTETILLVDDEPLILEVGRAILERDGYTVLTANNGKQGLDVYRSAGGEISLVILDLLMPEMGGYKCLASLLKFDPKARILVSSGYSGNSERKESLEGRAAGFIAKPYNAKQLRRKVREILDARLTENGGNT